MYVYFVNDMIFKCCPLVAVHEPYIQFLTMQNIDVLTKSIWLLLTSSIPCVNNLIYPGISLSKVMTQWWPYTNFGDVAQEMALISFTMELCLHCSFLSSYISCFFDYFLPSFGFIFWITWSRSSLTPPSPHLRNSTRKGIQKAVKQMMI